MRGAPFGAAERSGDLPLFLLREDVYGDFVTRYPKGLPVQRLPMHHTCNQISPAGPEEKQGQPAIGRTAQHCCGDGWGRRGWLGEGGEGGGGGGDQAGSRGGKAREAPTHARPKDAVGVVARADGIQPAAAAAVIARTLKDDVRVAIILLLGCLHL